MNATESGDELLDGLLELVARDAAASARCCASPGACGSTSGSCSSLLALESPHPSAQEPPKAKRRPVRRTKYQRKSDPNRARNERNGEIRGLKREIEDLSALLGALRAAGGAKRRLCIAPELLEPRARPGAGRGERVWEEICRDQQKLRLRAERENLELRGAVDGCSNRTRALQRSTLRSAEGLRSANNLYARLINRVYELPIDLDADTALYNRLVEDVAVSYTEADKVLELNGLAEPSSEPCSGANIRDGASGRSLDIFLRGFLPFDLDATVDVIWQFYSGSGKHRGPLYFKDTKAMGSSNDMVIEKFALELFANYTRADFRYRQVMRKYKEADRVVIVWSKGYMVCEPINIPSMPPYTQIRRTQRFTPYLAKAPNESELKGAKQDFGAIMDFMLSLDSANVHFQQFQDELMRRSLRKSHNR